MVILKKINHRPDVLTGLDNMDWLGASVKDTLGQLTEL